MDIYQFEGTESEFELLSEIRDLIGDWVQDFHYFMSGEASILPVSDCCELIGDDDGCCDSDGVDDNGCCDLGEANNDCCSYDPSDSTQ